MNLLKVILLSTSLALTGCASTTVPLVTPQSKSYPPAELLQPAKEPIPFAGGNEQDLLYNANENGVIWKDTRSQLDKLIQWVKEN